MKKKNILTMVQLALLTALVITFQLMGSFIHIGPTSISLVLIPIVIGAILVGPWGGAFLGFVFGAITLWAGITGADGFTNILFTSQPIATSLICLGKGTLAGLGAGYLYRFLAKKSRILGVYAAAAAAPIINTGIFILCGLTLVSQTLTTQFVSPAPLPAESAYESTLDPETEPETVYGETIIAEPETEPEVPPVPDWAPETKPQASESETLEAAVGTEQQTSASGTTLVYFLAITCAGLNFVFELLLNVIVAPAINTIVFAVQKQFGKRDYH